MLCISCKSTKEIVIEYRIPEINWPDFPKVGDYEKKDGKILVDEDYFRQLLIFKEEYKTERNKYNEKKEKLEAENE